MHHGSVIRRTRSAIIGLLLLLVTWRNNDSCDALQYQPVDVYANGDDCALILNGPGRTNVFDYTYNLLRGSYSPTAGSETCITYDAVNRAYLEARKRINVAQPKNKMWRPEDLATVGELLLDITTNLAQTYGLTYEEIEKSLPLIDTSKTLIRDVCPAFLSNVECRAGKYRRNDGLCTNLRNPTWGSSLSPFQRLMSPRFADGLTAPRISITGNDLPLSRVVSRTMHPDEGYHDHAGTVMVIAWGQFMDHDYTLTATPLDPLNRNDPEECCHRPPHLKNPYCNEILIPEDDYFYRLFNVKCQDFVRAFPAVRPGCRLGPRVPFNLLTGVLDGNTVYGITEAFARKLRAGYGGLLRMNPVFSEYGLKDLLPLKLDIPDEGCTRPNRSMYCFEAGEIRVNEQLVLTCMHTLMAREHNRIAKELIQINPHWDDETLYQETRRIVIAEIQHITYNEFLPILLGKDVMEKFGLLLEKNRYWNGYDESVNPAVIDAFASAAFRFGHSLLPTAVERWSKAHKFIASKRLSDLIRRPFDLYRAGVFDEYIMGLMNQVAQAMDDSITQEVTNHLFKKVGAKFGMDLVSFNMQRGREFGIPSYMEFRKFCGLPWVDDFDELHGSMPNETIRRYSSIFEHPADIDLWSGGVSERPLPGSMLGPTFACIIATQFSYSRRGDRFWYELPNQPSSFTLDQLNEIRKVKLAKVICDNTDLIDTIQIYPMVLPDHEINPRVPCRSGVLPSMDLSKWAEFPTANHAQYNAESAAARVHASFTEWSSVTEAGNEKRNITARKSSGTEADTVSWTFEQVGRKRGIDDGAEDSIVVSNAVDRTTTNDSSHGTGIVENVRVENPPGETYVDAFQTLNDHRETSNAEMGLARAKRAAGETRNYVGARERVVSAPRSDRLYRHPNLSYEEQRKRMNDTVKDDRANPNAVDTSAGKGMPAARGPKQSTTEIESSLMETKGHGCVPVFPSCDDTGNSRAITIGANRSARNDSKRCEKNGGKDNDDSSETESERQGEMKKFARRLTDDAAENEKKTRKSVERPRRNKGYINIRDHQKNVENKTTSDTPEYDPKKIPYVDVPDYADIREESLDEVDRREANRSRAKGGEVLSNDFAGPELRTDLRESSRSRGKNDERLEEEEEQRRRSLKSSAANENGERPGFRSTRYETEPTRVTFLDESTKSSNIPDKSRPANGRDKSSERRPGQTADDLNSKSKQHESDVSIDFRVSGEFSTSDEAEATGEERGEPSKGSRLPAFLYRKTDLSNPKFEGPATAGAEDERASREDAPRDGTRADGGSGSRAAPVIFDINEYRKPFDLDEFLKDDPIMKKLTRLDKETPAKYGRNGKRVSSDFKEAESADAFGERASGRGDATTEREEWDAFDDLPKSRRDNDFIDANAAPRNAKDKQNPRHETNEQESDERESLDRRDSLEKANGYLSKSPGREGTSGAIRFKLDAGREPRKDTEIQENRKKKDSARKEDMYDALPAISSKETHVSRQREDIAGGTKATDEPVPDYRNYWTTGYKSPRNRLDMEAQE